MKFTLWTAGLLTLLTALAALPLLAFEHKENEVRAQQNAAVRPWNSNYYYIPWGRQPVALVVPPTAVYQTNYNWGVPSSHTNVIYHQFQRPYPGPYRPGQGFLPRAKYPSDTDQFGVYYIRGPW